MDMRKYLKLIHFGLIRNNGYEKVFKTDTFWSNSSIFWAKGMQKANLFLYNQLKKRLPKKELKQKSN